MGNALASLRSQEEALLQRNQSLANIGDLGRQIYRLRQQRDILASEISDMEKLRDGLQRHLKMIMTAGKLATELKEMDERHEFLSEKVMAEEKRLSELKRERASLEERVVYFRSEAFKTDMFIDMMAKKFRNNPAFHGELPQAILKYLGLEGDKIVHKDPDTRMYKEKENPDVGRMRPRIAGWH